MASMVSLQALFFPFFSSQNLNFSALFFKMTKAAQLQKALDDFKAGGFDLDEEECLKAIELNIRLVEDNTFDL